MYCSIAKIKAITDQVSAVQKKSINIHEYNIHEFSFMKLKLHFCVEFNTQTHTLFSLPDTKKQHTGTSAHENLFSQSLFTIITKLKPTHIKKKSVLKAAENSVSAEIMIQALCFQADNVTVKPKKKKITAILLWFDSL